MNNQCENLEICGFFINFKEHSEVVKNAWIRIFCENLEMSELCERKIFKKKNGRIPPDNMAPTGKLM